MAEWTNADVIAVAPEFVSLDPVIVDRYIAIAEQEINPRVFGARTARAGALLTAHLLTVTPPAGVTPAAAPVGPIASESVGGVSVSYAVPALSGAGLAAGLALSRYGVEYSRMVRQCAAGPWVL